MADIQPIVSRPLPPTEDSPHADPVKTAELPAAPAAAESGKAAEKPVLDPQQRAEALEALRAALEEARPPAWRVSIHEDEETGDVVVEIKDLEGETVKQFPPEKILNLQRRLADLAGVVLDEAT